MIRPLLVKEIKDMLRDPRILVPFILSALIMPVIGLVISIPMRSAVEEAIHGAQNIGFVNLDNGPYPTLLKEWLAQRGFSITPLPYSAGKELYKAASESNLRIILIVPQGFSQSIEGAMPLNVTVVSVIDEISFISGVETQPIIQELRNFYLQVIANRTRLDPRLLSNPVNVEPQTYIASKGVFLPADPASLAGLLMAALLIPVIVMSISMAVMQMSATSMAIENEEKTLETLLTMPVPTRDILTAKLLGMFVVSMIGSLFEVIGMALYFIIYFATFIPVMPGEPHSPSLASLTPGPSLFNIGDFLLLIPSLLISLFFAAGLGVVIGALSRDVRIANTIMSPVSMLVILPGYFVVFAPSKLVGPLLKAVFYVFPLTQPTLLAKDIVGSKPPVEVPLYLLLATLLTLLLVWATSYLFSLETLSRVQYAVERLAAKIRRKR
ncbi:MAG: ABC transporter permease [Infirmifilum sp.]